MLRRAFLAAGLFLSLTGIANATLALDGTPAGAVANNASTVNIPSVNTVAANDIVIVCSLAEWLNATGASGTVASISGGSLTWAKRSSATLHGGTGTAWQDLECWWAYSASIQAGMSVTVTWNLPSATNFDGASAVGFAVKGFLGTNYQTNPWDSNGALPAIATSSGTSAPTLSTLSTTSANAFLIGAVGTTANTNWSAQAGTGYTFAANGFSFAGTNWASSGAEYQVVSATQSGATVSWAASAVGWTLIGDALAESGGSGVATVHTFTLLGVGQ